MCYGFCSLIIMPITKCFFSFNFNVFMLKRYWISQKKTKQCIKNTSKSNIYKEQHQQWERAHVWEVVCICAGDALVRLCTWKALDRWLLQLALNVASFFSVLSLFHIESVSVSIMIKVDFFSHLDCSPGISWVCLSCPHHLLLFDSGEPGEIRALTVSAHFFCLAGG